MELHGFTDKSTFREEFVEVYDPQRNHLGPEDTFPGVAVLECSKIPVFDIEFETEAPFGNSSTKLDESHLTESPADEVYRSIYKLRGSPSFWWQYETFEDWAVAADRDFDDKRLDDVRAALESDKTPVCVATSRKLYDRIWSHMMGHEVRTKIFPPLNIHDVTLCKTEDLTEESMSYKDLYRDSSEYHLLNRETVAESLLKQSQATE